MSVAENEPISKTRFKMIESMVRPCGAPPKNEDDE
tara:strand:+ start:567 stop:671 length:105 start_codon:yes stop_codon:yes gene_type:complete